MDGIEMRHVPYRDARQGLTCSFGFELQGPCSAFTSWRARERDPKTFPLAAHNLDAVEGDAGGVDKLLPLGFANTSLNPTSACMSVWDLWSSYDGRPVRVTIQKQQISLRRH